MIQEFRHENIYAKIVTASLIKVNKELRVLPNIFAWKWSEDDGEAFEVYERGLINAFNDYSG